MPGDRRRFRLRVAGPAALLVMKAYKIGEHLDEGRPVEDKDAYDVLRLLRDVPMTDLASRFGRILNDPLSTASATRGRELLGRLFGERDATGSEMAGRAAGFLADPEVVAVACAALTRDLLNGLSSG